MVKQASFFRVAMPVCSRARSWDFFRTPMKLRASDGMPCDDTRPVTPRRSWHGEPRTYSIAFTPLPGSGAEQPPEVRRQIYPVAFTGDRFAVAEAVPKSRSKLARN